MGVCKFFRYISERYPALNEKLKQNQILEFDNLYLDMNGIIHLCSHPNDDPLFLITEEEIFRNIFHYIEMLFLLIKPRKLFFMAVDGVAPRAKMNQQRSRRFCSARNAQTGIAEAKAKGKEVSEDNLFDSNCITPGTVFMDKLTAKLKYFITEEIQTNKLWQDCKIILTGSEVPGEGEHKIMDYIRYMKTQPDYDPNTRHCLYGLDADLIMLGLSTHQAHFTLLREEVLFGKRQNKLKTPEDTQFYLLHISLLRDYVDYEFSSLKEKLMFSYDLERIIDDWILLMFLIGNDFIPNAPNITIPKSGIPILYQVYKAVLPTLKGYINEGGHLNLERFEVFMEKLSEIDLLMFSANFEDINLDEQVRRSFLEPQREIPKKKTRNKDLDGLIRSTMMLSLGYLEEDNEDEQRSAANLLNCQLYKEEFLEHKKNYYLNKMDFAYADVESLTRDYIHAIQWNLYYYYEGCQSWLWFYPHHYAPYISDIKNIKEMQISFEMGQPFYPFEQLLSVLPPHSSSLLPKALQHLQTDETSPIVGYYPESFETDLNGKKHEWEAVVLLPFIDVVKLRRAMQPCLNRLTPEEVQRNKYGPMVIYSYVAENSNVEVPSADLPNATGTVRTQLLNYKDLRVPREILLKTMYPKAKLDIFSPGLATFRYVKLTASFEKGKVKVFERTSLSENMILHIVEKPVPDINVIATEFLGKTIFVDWPYLKEALVVAVSDGDIKLSLTKPELSYSNTNVNAETLGGSVKSMWVLDKASLATKYQESRGIDLRDVHIVIDVRLRTGGKYTVRSGMKLCYEKQWAEKLMSCPYQVVVKAPKMEYKTEPLYQSIHDAFKPGTTCFMLGQPHYGSMVQVLEVGPSEHPDRVSITINVKQEPLFDKLTTLKGDQKNKYMPGNVAAAHVGINSYLFSKITGTIFVVQDLEQIEKTSRHNIGLNLKFNKRNEEIPGYTRKKNGNWLYSNKTINLLRNYIDKYPDLFNRLWSILRNGTDVFHEHDLFNKGSSELNDVLSWLKEQSPDVKSRPCGIETLETETIKEIEEIVDAAVKDEDTNTKRVFMYMKPQFLFKPSLHMCNSPPDPKAQHFLLDRICNIKETSKVPVGHKGTIINIEESKDDQEDHYDILFDKPFPGGYSILECSAKRGYRLPSSSFINISHGIRVIQRKLVNAEIVGGTGNTVPRRVASTKEGNRNLTVLAPVKSELPRNIKSNNQRPNTQSDTPIRQAIARNPANIKVQDKSIIKQKVNNNTKPAPEFQELWNMLHEQQELKSSKPVLLPANEEHSTKVLKALLNISDTKPPQTSSNQTRPAPKPFPPPPPIPTMVHPPPMPSFGETSSSKGGTATPPLVKQLFDYARKNEPPKELLKCKSSRNYLQLRKYFEMKNLGNPRFICVTMKETKLKRAHIFIPDIGTIVGDLCATSEEAVTSVADKVCIELNLPYSYSCPPAPNRTPQQIYHNRQNNQEQRMQGESKQEVKNSIAFVPLQAQKKCRNLVAGQDNKQMNHDAKQSVAQPAKEVHADPTKAPGPSEKENKKDVPDLPVNLQPTASKQNTRKTNQPKRSRIAANFNVQS